MIKEAGETHRCCDECNNIRCRAFLETISLEI